MGWGANQHSSSDMYSIAATFPGKHGATSAHVLRTALPCVNFEEAERRTFAHEESNEHSDLRDEFRERFGCT